MFSWIAYFPSQNPATKQHEKWTKSNQGRLRQYDKRTAKYVRTAITKKAALAGGLVLLAVASLLLNQENIFAERLVDVDLLHFEVGNVGALRRLESLRNLVRHKDPLDLLHVVLLDNE